MNNFWEAMTMTLLAGLSTGIGSLIALFTKKTEGKFLGFCLSFAAGVMLLVSMTEILNEATAKITSLTDDKKAALISAASFFGGMILIFIIDKIIPDKDLPKEMQKASAEDNAERRKKVMVRSGLFTAIAITIHNFPEGLTTFVSAIENPSLALPVVIAIAIHNIPEGIAVSVPLYMATNSKKKAFVFSFLSGLSEPIGAIAGYFLLRGLAGEMITGILLAAVSGIMVFICIDDLLPSAKENGGPTITALGFISGMAIMNLSVLLLL